MQRYNILLRQPNVWPFLEVATPKSWCTTPKPTPTHGMAARPRAHIRTQAAAHETGWEQPPTARHAMPPYASRQHIGVKSFYHPGQFLQPTGPQLIARQPNTDCKTAHAGMQNGRSWPVKRAVWQCKTASTPTTPALCKHISSLLPACHGHAAKPLPYGCRSPAMARNDCLKKTF